jgi:hypothetical protein
VLLLLFIDYFPLQLIIDYLCSCEVIQAERPDPAPLQLPPCVAAAAYWHRFILLLAPTRGDSGRVARPIAASAVHSTTGSGINLHAGAAPPPSPRRAPPFH